MASFATILQSAGILGGLGVQVSKRLILLIKGIPQTFPYPYKRC
jgi:hypothetical protein